MKELSIEEKAKAYDRAIEKAKTLYENANGMILKKWVEQVFPELKESEDEKIRKWLITQLELKSDVNNPHDLELMILKSIAWLEKPVSVHLSHDDEIMIRQLTEYFTTGKGLQNTNDTVVEWLEDVKRKLEKQSEQKSIDNLTQQEIMDIAVAKCFDEQKHVDKVEPKFHEGDWVVVSTTKGDRVVQIASVEYSKDGYPSYFTTDGRWFGNGTKTRLLTDKDVETITIPESKVIINKVEPKFKVGDWITDGDKTTQIVAVGTGLYIINRKDMSEVSLSTEYIEKWYHLWTIQDAKDGDVLVTDKSVFIYAKVSYNKPYAYCGVDKFGVFKDNCLEHDWANSVDNIHPATKKQRDTLMKAMADAGYTFDFDKKESKKIEQNTAWSEED